MNVSTTIPATVQIRRGRLLSLVAGVAAAAAAITWAVSAYAVDDGSSQTRAVAPAAPLVTSAAIPAAGYLDAVEPQSTWVRAVTSMTPVQLIEAFGTDTPTAVALAGLTPKERQHVESIITSTPAQLRAAFGSQSQAVAPAAPQITSTAIPPTGYLDAVKHESTWVQAVTSMTPVQLIEAFGTDARTAVALAGLAPKERQYVESIITSPPAELRAAFGTGR